MNRSDLIRIVSQQTDATAPQMEEYLDLLLEAIETALRSGEPVVIKNFGRFEVRERDEVIRHNPRSGVEVKVPKKRGVLFRPAPAFKTHVQHEEYE